MKTKLLLCFITLSLAVGLTRADETVTVSANSTDVSDNLDLRTVATLFGQAKDLDEFEKMLNNPDSAFSNLDLNGDGQVDYLRVIETSDGNKRLVVLQAVLAKDVYQDVASIYVEKDESDKVSVQIIGDAYIYGKNYIIEPVYLYRPLIYDWFWAPGWACCWTSPWYWDYWPGWWRPYYCCTPYVYWNRCYCYHYCYPVCSYRSASVPHVGYEKMRTGVSRSDYATLHPENSFSTRNTGVANARSLSSQRRKAGVSSPQSMAMASRSVSSTASTTARAATSGNGRVSTTRTTQGNTSRTFGSQNVRSAEASSASRTSAATTSRASSASTTSRAVAAANGTVSSSSSTASRSSSTTYSTRAVSTPTYSGSSSAVRSSTSTTSTSRSSSTTTSSSRSSSTSTRGERVEPSSWSSTPSSSWSSSSSSSSSRSSGNYGGSYSGGGGSGGGSSSRSSGGSMSGSMGGSSRSGGGGSTRR